MRIALLALLLAPSIAAADTTAAVTKAFTAFVDAVAASQPVPRSIDTFITPYHDDDPVPKDLARVRALLGKAKVKVTSVVASKTGKSAWLVADISGKDTLRASAFLVLTSDGWQVTATHWSVAVPNRVVEMCGAVMNEWTIKPSVPKDLEAPVRSVVEALRDHSFVKVLSDDKHALVIGSAPDEVFTGGSSIKSIFKKWAIGAYSLTPGDELGARAGTGPDGELMWIALAVDAPAQLCTTYRTLLVLQKEKAGWRIVQQHYSEQIP